jgi:hypothetical protein
LIGQLLLWLLLVLGISRFDTAALRRWRRRHVDAGPHAPLLSIDAPVESADPSVVLSMDDPSVSWQSSDGDAVVPEVDRPDSEPHEAGVE